LPLVWQQRSDPSPQVHRCFRQKAILKMRSWQYLLLNSSEAPLAYESDLIHFLGQCHTRQYEQHQANHYKPNHPLTLPLSECGSFQQVCQHFDKFPTEHQLFMVGVGSPDEAPLLHDRGLRYCRVLD
jgi:hypothetical protein